MIYVMYLHVIWIMNTNIYIYIIKRVYALCTIENKATFSGKAFQTAQVDPSVKDAFDAPARRFG